MLLRWTKTAQDNSEHFLVPIPRMNGRAFQNMCQNFPTKHNKQPLFTYTAAGHQKVLTATVLSKTFKALVANTGLGFDSRSFSLHSLRHRGASLSYMAGADLLQIKRHGFVDLEALIKL